MPAYNQALPYAQKGYKQGQYLTKEVVFPYVWLAQRHTKAFLNQSIWPQLQILYGENVEPQLTRISERLARYKGGKKLKVAAAEDVDSTSVLSSASSGTSSLSSSVSASATVSDATISSASVAASASAESEEDVKEKIANDLKQWQEKFAKAADKGSDDLAERVQEITENQINNQAHSVGQAHVKRLNGTAQSSLKMLQFEINRAVKALAEHANEDEIEAAYKEIVSSVRDNGHSIREKAQALRSWKQNYDQETFALVKAASDSTLEVIDNIRDLGLQEIGMRWAWMEGVTYKDWSKYHQLKKTFDEWRDEVEAVAMKHEGLARAKHEGADVEEQGMSIAEEAAKELARLKDVARWKLYARDATDNFDTKVIPATPWKLAKDAKSRVMENVEAASEAVAGSSQGSVESILSVAHSTAAEISSSASSAVVDDSHDTVERMASKASGAVIGSKKPSTERVSSSLTSAADAGSSAAEDVASTVSEAVLGSQASTDRFTSVVSSRVGDVSSAAGSVLSAGKFKVDSVTDVVKGTPAPSSQSILSQASKGAESAASDVSEAAAEATEEVQNVYHQMAEAADSATVEAKHTAQKVMGGVMAQVVVEAREPILDDVVDDEETYSQKAQQVVNDLGNHAESLTSAIMAAMKRPTATQGSMESVSSLASGQFEKAFAAASSAMYGTETGTLESMSSAATDRYQQAITAASYAIYGTPSPLAIVDQASSGYAAVVDHASSNYAAATDAAISAYSDASTKLAGTPKPAYEKAMSSIEESYSAALSAADAGLSSLTATPTTAVLAAQASSNYAAATNAAMSAYSAASVKLAGTPKPAYEKAMLSIEESYSAALSAANAGLSSLTATTTTAMFAAQASSNYAAATNAAMSAYSDASAKLVGTSKPGYELAMSSVQEQYSRAMAAANSAFGSMTGSPTQGALESISGLASSRLADALSMASAQYVWYPLSNTSTIANIM